MKSPKVCLLVGIALALCGLPFDSRASITPLNNPVISAPGTITALRGIVPTATMNGWSIPVLGYYTSGDGAGGTFVYNSASSATDNGGTIIAPSSGSGRWMRQQNGFINVRCFGAKGDGSTNDTSALTACDIWATANSASLIVSSPVYILGSVNITSKINFERGGFIEQLGGGATLTMSAGYIVPGPFKCFGTSITVKIAYWKQAEMYFENFGAVVLTDPVTGTNDSTVAIQKLFASLTATAEYPNTTYNGVNIPLIGMYGISDQIHINNVCVQMLGNGASLQGAGFRWVGAAVVGNASKAMFLIDGSNFARFENMTILGVNTADATKRLQSCINIKSDSINGLARRCVFKNIAIGDYYGYFGLGGADCFVYGVMSSGDNANDDFHLFENVVYSNCDTCVNIGKQQNVYWRFNHISFNAPTAIGMWIQEASQFTIDGLYCGNFGAGTYLFKIGDGTSNVLSIATINELGGEGLTPTAVILNKGAGNTLRWSFNNSQISVGTTVPFIANDTASSGGYNFTFINSDVSGLFKTLGDNSTGPFYSNLTLQNCVGLENINAVVNVNFCQLTVQVQNSWANHFHQNNGSTNYASPFNYFKILTPGNCNSNTLLTAFQDNTGIETSSISIGPSMAGITSRINDKSYVYTTLAQATLTFTGLIPANSLVFGIQAVQFDVNILNINNSQSVVFIGDSTDVKRYGYIGVVTTYGMSVAGLSAPFFTAPAIDVVLSGASYGSTITYSQSTNTLTASSGIFAVGMVGRTFTYLTGGNAGTAETISGFTSSTVVTVGTSLTDSGHAGWITNPFISSQSEIIGPVYMTMYDNIANFTGTGSTAFILKNTSATTSPH